MSSPPGFHRLPVQSYYITVDSTGREPVINLNPLVQWTRSRPRLATGAWFGMIRLAWAVYWFGFTPPGPHEAIRSGLAPVLVSTAAAFLLGYWVGTIILKRNWTPNLLSATLYGILINHLVTVVYLPFAVAIRIIGTGQASGYLGNLMLSYIFSLAGVPIHTVIGGIAGLGLYLAARYTPLFAPALPAEERT